MYITSRNETNFIKLTTRNIGARYMHNSELFQYLALMILL